MQTTAADLIRLYDKTIKLLEKRVDDGTISAADLANLGKLLEKAEILTLLRQSSRPPNPDAPKADDLPFPAADEIDPGEFPELRN